MALSTRRSTHKSRKDAKVKLQSRSGRSRAFWILLAFLVILLLTGGSARKDVPALIALRPISVLLAFYAMATATLDQWRHYRAQIAVMAAVVLLVLVHLVPLPPAVWQALPGRSILLDTQSLAGQPDIWFPLTMVPEGGLNALYSLFTPIAVFFLAIQLSDNDNFWLLVALIGLALLTALVGVAQAGGVSFSLYSIHSEMAGLFANRNHQAALLALLFPMLGLFASVGERFGFNRGVIRIMAATLALAIVLLVLVTGSRMGLVACVVAIASMAFIRLDLVPDALKRRKISGKLVLGVGVVGLVGLIGLVAAMTSRNVAVARLAEGGDDLRFSVWPKVWSMLPDYLPWGSGIGSYVEVYQIHEPSELLISSYSNHVHNDWLEIALTAGIPGLVLLAITVVMFVLAALRSYEVRGLQGKFNRLGLIMILVLAIASTVDYPLRTPIMAAVFAVATMWSCRPNHTVREVKGREANV
ncbi:O-antigen ligase family protein [Blastomonas sp.]|uniref:O-antigen ligase family protein n=1 Tax=Blastomonas sp. TaxID=1909299 RepID=UPI00258AE48F|nr:O-antigen ligase family protein [Blastomonas sp.]